MLPINDLGSDSPLYFSLLGHPCEHALKHINRTVVTSALRFRGQLRCPETNHRPCASVETRTCTNPSTEYCSAKYSPLASESPREWIRIRHSVRRFQLHPDRQLANRAAHRRANLRGNLTSLPRELAASLLSHVWLLKVHILSGSSALRVCHCLACLFVDSKASQINSSQINLGGAHDVSKQRSSKF